LRNIEREERRRRKKVVGRDRGEGRILFTRRGNYRRGMGCQGGDQRNEGHGHSLSFSEDEKHIQ